ncbi:MAG: hypothetical protein JO360_15520 [Acidobacteria bacterium]|nr:hypothetical protein [Acidobacteriota bacterium]
MKRLFVAMACVLFCAGVSVAQKGKAEPDYYPMGYAGDIFTGEVTAFDNDARTLTLTFIKDKKPQTFVVYLPDAPYEWGRDLRNFRVVDFPFDKTAKFQTFKFVSNSQGGAADSAPTGGSGIKKRPSPPPENVISDFKDFMGRNVTVYYTEMSRTVGDKKEKYNEVWRIRILPDKKK